MTQENQNNLIKIMAVMWTPLVVGALAMVVFRNLYGVAVLFTGYGFSLIILGQDNKKLFRRISLGWGVACLIAAGVLAAIQFAQ